MKKMLTRIVVSAILLLTSKIVTMTIKIAKRGANGYGAQEPPQRT